MEPKKRILFISLITLCFSLAFRLPSVSIPITAEDTTSYYSFTDWLITKVEGLEFSLAGSDAAEEAKATIQLNEFISKLNTGEPDVVRGIYTEEQFALSVVEQPSNKPAFVSSIDDVVTDFLMPKKYGVIGMIAHNYLAGRYFFGLELGDVVQIVYGDGSTSGYRITEIKEFQALSPKSPFSDFLNLETEEVISSTQLFKRVYMGGHHLTLQTCIQVGLEDSWGRLFLIAERI